ncbi:MAG: RNA polymerase sigma factor [Saprospiraceae bacterium]|nr:RNA polymerase sigma factor [Saprospiraceae bacterium]
MKEEEQKKIFNGWIKVHSALLFKIVRAYAFNEVDREELFQEITIQLWRSIPSFRGDAAVTTWMYRISLNTALRWAASEQKHRQGVKPIGEIEHVLMEKPNQQDERLSWLYEEIAGLHEIDRSLTLLLLDGFSYKEMAQMLGISESNIGVKLHRIKKYLIDRSKKAKHNGI